MVKYLTREDAEWNEELTRRVKEAEAHLQDARVSKKAQWRKGRFKPLTKLEKAEQELLFATKNFEMKYRQKLMKKNPTMLPY